MKVLRLLTEQSPAPIEIAHLLLRVAVGAVFVAYGWDDLVALGVPTMVEMQREAGVPLPELAAPFVAYTQAFGGILFVLGALTRAVGVGFAIIMFGAAVIVHDPTTLLVSADGIGFVLVLGIASLLVVATGPGRFSVDHLLVRAAGGRPARVAVG